MRFYLLQFSADPARHTIRETPEYNKKVPEHHPPAPSRRFMIFVPEVVGSVRAVLEWSRTAYWAVFALEYPKDTLNPSLFNILYVHPSKAQLWICCGRSQTAWDLEPAHSRGDLVRQIADAVVRLNQGKKQHPILICDEAHLLPHPALEQD